jgi:hypothetical protein
MNLESSAVRKTQAQPQFRNFGVKFINHAQCLNFDRRLEILKKRFHACKSWMCVERSKN